MSHNYSTSHLPDWWVVMHNLLKKSLMNSSTWVSWLDEAQFRPCRLSALHLRSLAGILHTVTLVVNSSEFVVSLTTSRTTTNSSSASFISSLSIGISADTTVVPAAIITSNGVSLKSIPAWRDKYTLLCIPVGNFTRDKLSRHLLKKTVTKVLRQCCWIKPGVMPWCCRLPILTVMSGLR